MDDELRKQIREEFLREWIRNASEDEILEKLVQNDERAKFIKALMKGQKEDLNPMGWLLYHRTQDDKYRLYSTVVDAFVTEWDTKENTKKFWLEYEQKQAEKKVESYMKWIDREV